MLSRACKLRNDVVYRTHHHLRRYHRFSSSSSFTSALISAEELSQKLPRVQLIDASWFMPNDAEGRTGVDQHAKAHIPSAIFFDVDACVTPSSLPHMMPDRYTLAAKLGQMGISRDDAIVVYDSNMYLASARVWLMLRHFGHSNVKVLNGGLRSWESLPKETKLNEPIQTEYVIDTAEEALVVNKDQMLASLEDAQNGSINLFDARPNGRFTGEAPEPRPGLPSGHMPGAKSIPFVSLINNDGTLKTRIDLQNVFSEAGVSMDQLLKPTITTCGSGVSAPVINLAVHELTGSLDSRMYDGSWTQWASDPSTPKKKTVPE